MEHVRVCIPLIRLVIEYSFLPDEIPEPDANADKRWADLGLHEFAESSGISPAK